ncbi:MAG: NOL1/NOP2/sun family putative RNA methylase [Nanoarchaeota archaeon]
MKKQKNFKPIENLKPEFLERLKILLPEKKDFENYINILSKQPVKSIRCNTLKISPNKLKEKLENNYNWKIKQPWKNYPEIMIIESELSPGELGRSLEHLLGYYYVQELASTLPVISLNLDSEKQELILDLAAAPGSKTTQIASEMENSGTIIANEVSLGRLKILASNLERCGVTNTIITRKDGPAFCKRILKYNPEIKFDKILIDAPCSGEGTLRSSQQTYRMWNPKTIKQLSKLQKIMLSNALNILKEKGEIIYSTCTHAPEENEEIINSILENEDFKGKIKIEKLNLPKELFIRQGITKWKDKTYSEEIKKTARIYPHDNDTEGFFIAKLKKIKK